MRVPQRRVRFVLGVTTALLASSCASPDGLKVGGPCNFKGVCGIGLVCIDQVCQPSEVAGGDTAGEEPSGEVSGERLSGMETSGEVAGESVSGESVSGESIAGESVAGESVSGESVSGETAGESVSGETAGESISGETAGESISGELAGEDISGEFAGEIAGMNTAGEVSSICGDGEVARDETCDPEDLGNTAYWCNTTCDATPPPCHVHNACPTEWVMVSGGQIQVNMRPVNVTSFWMMRREVQESEYAACVRHGECEALNSVFCPNAGAQLPLTCVSPQALESFAGWAGAEVPSKLQWTYAATNGGVFTYPWGNAPVGCAYANTPECFGSMLRLATSCSYPQGVSVDGACDLIGNAQELVKDETGAHVTVGGSFRTSYTPGDAFLYNQQLNDDLGGRLVFSPLSP